MCGQEPQLYNYDIHIVKCGADFSTISGKLTASRSLIRSPYAIRETSQIVLQEQSAPDFCSETLRAVSRNRSCQRWQGPATVRAFPHHTVTMLVLTSILPCTDFEYGQN